MTARSKLFTTVGAMLITACSHAGSQRPVSNFLLGLNFSRGTVFEPALNRAFENQNLKTFSNSNGEILKVIITENINEKDARNLIEQKQALIVRLFETEKEPYFGNVLDKTKCLLDPVDKIKLISTDASLQIGFPLYATAEFVYGTCAKENYMYTSKLTYLYCKGRKIFFELKYFNPISNPSDEKNEFSCSEPQIL